MVSGAVGSVSASQTFRPQTTNRFLLLLPFPFLAFSVWFRKTRTSCVAQRGRRGGDAFTVCLQAGESTSAAQLGPNGPEQNQTHEPSFTCFIPHHPRPQRNRVTEPVRFTTAGQPRALIGQLPSCLASDWPIVSSWSGSCPSSVPGADAPAGRGVKGHTLHHSKLLWSEFIISV